MITSEQQTLLDNAYLDVSISDEGVIVYQASFERQWKAAGGDFDHLLGAIQDSIFQTADGDEDIDWAAVECEMEAEA